MHLHQVLFIHMGHSALQGESLSFSFRGGAMQKAGRSIDKKGENNSAVLAPFLGGRHQFFLKSPALTIESLPGSKWLFTAAFTCAGVSAAILASNSMSQAKVRLANR